MSGFIVENQYPGATTCIIVGGLTGIDPAIFHAYRHVLWWCHDPALAAFTVPVERPPLSHSEPGLIIERFLRRDPRHLPSLYVTADTTEPTYQAVVTAAHTVLESAHRTRLTRQKDGFIWQKHLLQNAPAYIRQRLPAAWAGALRGLPAFICGAGPSLDVSLPALAAAADRAVIFSADSALRALARHGVAADFAVSIDAAKVPEKCLPATHPPHRVVLASVSPPAWQTALPAAQIFFLSGPQVTDDWLATQGVPRTALAVAESCGSTALELAHHLGCDPIYLFGMDLAVDPANQARRHQAHAAPALYTQSHYDPTTRLPRVPGNYTETVPCFALGDWRELDARLAARPDSRVINVTDRGARLRGTTVVHPVNFSLPAPSNAKPTKLAALAPSTATSTTALKHLRALGDRNQQAIPALQKAFAQGGTSALAAAFVPLVVDPENGRALGSFALKIMPHLVPPIEGKSEMWQTLIDEFYELARIAQNAAKA